MVTPEERLSQLGLQLPSAPAPAAAYLPVTKTGQLMFTAGQLPLGDDGLLAEGRVGAEIDLDTAVRCARQCALNVVALAKAELGELSRVRRVVKLVVFVASIPEFTEQHLVANGASEVLADVFGDAGRHARSAVGAACLPLNTPVEVEAIIEVA